MSQCGYVAIIGQPNVGKSTLLNYLLGQKISITSRKPQTTRHQIVGIKTQGDNQAIFIDTPGMHQGSKKQLNRVMNRAADTVLHDVDVILFMISAGTWQTADGWIVEKLASVKAPVVLVINKIDRLKDRGSLLPFIDTVKQHYDFANIIPLSAQKGDNVDALTQTIFSHLPTSEHVYSEDELTNRSLRFLAAEIVREKLFYTSGQEVPYATAVEIELFKEKGKLVHIAAVIMVERDGQKRIIIGKGGENLKRIGQQARQDLEAMLHKKVYLQLWVKIKGNWSDDARMLKSLGYDE